MGGLDEFVWIEMVPVRGDCVVGELLHGFLYIV